MNRFEPQTKHPGGVLARLLRWIPRDGLSPQPRLDPMPNAPMMHRPLDDHLLPASNPGPIPRRTQSQARGGSARGTHTHASVVVMCQTVLPPRVAPHGHDATPASREGARPPASFPSNHRLSRPRGGPGRHSLEARAGPARRSATTRSLRRAPREGDRRWCARDLRRAATWSFGAPTACVPRCRMPGSRSGRVHTGEVELRGNDVAGSGSTSPLVCGARPLRRAARLRTVKDLVAGSDYAFDSRGVHSLKGVPEDWSPRGDLMLARRTPA